MSLDINWEDLSSTVVAIARGEHTIGVDAERQQEEEENPGVIKWIFDISSRLAGWAVSAFSFGSWLVSTVLGGIVSASTFLWNFNINATDETLDQGLTQARVALMSYFGSTVGCGFGWAAGMLFGVGVHAGAAAIAKALGIPILAFDKAAMMKALKEATDEGLEEMASLLEGLAKLTINLFVRSLATGLFKNIRMVIKLINNFPGRKQLLPNPISDMIERWGEPGSQPWSIALFVEEAVESIPIAEVRAFVDSFLEESYECFIQAGYVYAASVDRIMAERADMREAVLGTQQVVEIVPDREAPNERVVVAGREQVVRTTVMQTLATHQMVANRDVGQIVGQPANEQMLQQAPVTTLTLRLLYYPVDSPPFTADSMRLRGITGKWTTAAIKIPYIDPGDLTWEKIKRAAGLVGRVKGKYRCYGYLAGRKVEVYAATEQQGEQWLKDLTQLSEAKDQLTGIGFTRRANNPASSNSLSEQYPSVLVHPAYAIILSQKLAIDRTEGRATLQGNFIERSQRIELWPDTEPAYAKEILTAMKQYHTPLETLGIGFRRP